MASYLLLSAAPKCVAHSHACRTKTTTPVQMPLASLKEMSHNHVTSHRALTRAALRANVLATSKWSHLHSNETLMCCHCREGIRHNLFDDDIADREKQDREREKGMQR